MTAADEPTLAIAARCPVCGCSRHYGSRTCMCPDCPKPDSTPATDATVEAGYAYLGERGRAVARTVTIDGSINLDLDNQGYAIGVELIGRQDFDAAAWQILMGAKFA